MNRRTRSRIWGLIVKLRRAVTRAERLLPTPTVKIGTHFTGGDLEGCTVTYLGADGSTLLRADRGWDVLVSREVVEWHVKQGYIGRGER